MTRIVQCVPVLAQGTLQARLDFGAASGCILEMFCMDNEGIHRALRFTVSHPFDGGNGSQIYPGSTWSGRDLNVHLRGDNCKINILQA